MSLSPLRMQFLTRATSLSLVTYRLLLISIAISPVRHRLPTTAYGPVRISRTYCWSNWLTYVQMIVPCDTSVTITINFNGTAFNIPPSAYVLTPIANADNRCISAFAEANTRKQSFLYSSAVPHTHRSHVEQQTYILVPASCELFTLSSTKEIGKSDLPLSKRRRVASEFWNWSLVHCTPSLVSYYRSTCSWRCYNNKISEYSGTHIPMLWISTQSCKIAFVYLIPASFCPQTFCP